MPAASPQTVKLKSTLRLLVSRLRIAQQKDTALSVVSRREMADLLGQSREASARIRVENIIHTDITVELMEILELYAELLQARAGLLDMRDKNVKEGLPHEDTGLEEAAASIIYAGPRLPRDIRELGTVRSMLIDRFGKDFAVQASENTGNIVPKRVVDKLRIDPPKEALVQAYLEEIARTYGVEWPRNREEVQRLEAEVRDEGNDNDEGEGGGQKEAPLLADGALPPSTPKKIDLGGLQKATPPAAIGGAKSPVSVAPPGARTDNPNPQVRLPGGEGVRKDEIPAPKQASVGVLGSPPTVDDLAKRFSALKR